MFKSSTVLYEIFIENTISNAILHSFLLSFEFFICVFPYVISSVHKIFLLTKTYSFNHFEHYLGLLSLLKNNCISNRKVYNSPYVLIVTGCVIFFTGLFILLSRFYKKRFTLFCFERVLT